jgi:hypothetical protein
MARLAASLSVLRAEILTESPETIVYWIGDPDHQARDSDHNPNDAGVVCAIDVMPGHGLDLAALAEAVRRRRQPAGKYVIYQDRIASASRGWEWRDHTGEYHEHVHVSVGVGPDGDSTGPYDDTSPWGIGDDMSITDEDVARIATATARAVANYNTGSSKNAVPLLNLLRQAAATSTALLPGMDAILAAAQDDGDTTVVLDPAALAVVQELRTAVTGVAEAVAALPEETADAVLDAESARLAD